MANPNNYGLSQETLDKALHNMKVGGYLPQDYTVTDLIDYWYAATEGIPFMVKAKITQWAK